MAPPKKAKAPARKAPGVRARATEKKHVTHTTNEFGINMTIHGGTQPTPRGDLMSPRSKMLLVPADAEGMVFDSDESLVLKSGVTVNGNYCEVDGDDCEVNGSFCLVNGDRARVNGQQCIVRGQGAVVTGNYAIITKESVTKEVSGSHCTIRGIVLKQTGPNYALDGGSIAVQISTGRGLIVNRF